MPPLELRSQESIYLRGGKKCHFLCGNLKMENSMSGHTFCSFRTTDLNPTTDLIHLDLSEHTVSFSSTRAKMDPARPNGSFPPARRAMTSRSRNPSRASQGVSVHCVPWGQGKGGMPWLEAKTWSDMMWTKEYQGPQAEQDIQYFSLDGPWFLCMVKSDEEALPFFHKSKFKHLGCIITVWKKSPGHWCSINSF